MKETSLCLPKGDNLKAVSAILEEISFPIEGYTSDNRTYRPVIETLKNTRAKIFAEKDVAIQVSVGNYDIGFCSLDWIEEQLAKSPKSDLKILKRVGRSYKKIFACCHKSFKGESIEEFLKLHDDCRIISEYPGISEHFAIDRGMKKYTIFPAWGSVEVYPPEHGEIVILAAEDDKSLEPLNLKPLDLILESELCIIINQRAYETRDISTVLNFFRKIEVKEK